MSPRICRACGEPIKPGAGEYSRNPNLCASCSSLLDGMGEDFPGTEPVMWQGRPLQGEREADGHEVVHE